MIAVRALTGGSAVSALRNLVKRASSHTRARPLVKRASSAFQYITALRRANAQDARFTILPHYSASIGASLTQTL